MFYFFHRSAIEWNLPQETTQNVKPRWSLNRRWSLTRGYNVHHTGSKFCLVGIIMIAEETYPML